MTNFSCFKLKDATEMMNDQTEATGRNNANVFNEIAINYYRNQLLRIESKKNNTMILWQEV